MSIRIKAHLVGARKHRAIVTRSQVVACSGASSGCLRNYAEPVDKRRDGEGAGLEELYGWEASENSRGGRER